MKSKVSLNFSLLAGLLFASTATLAQEAKSQQDLSQQVRSHQNSAYIGINALIAKTVVGEEGDNAGFKPVGLGLKVGKYVAPQIALEMFGYIGIKEDEDIDIDLELVSNAGVIGRFESPEKEGFKLNLSLGYAMTELEMQRSSTSLPDRELYHGFAYGGGAELRIMESDSFIDLQAIRVYRQGHLSIDTLSLGVRYEF